MDLMEVFALHVLGFDQARLEQTGDESARTREGIKDVDILVCQGRVELVFEDLIDGADNKVNTLNWSIDDAELLNSPGECAFEELLVDVLDDGLLALQVVNLADICTDGFIEVCQNFGVFLEGFLSWTAWSG